MFGVFMTDIARVASNRVGNPIAKVRHSIQMAEECVDGGSERHEMLKQAVYFANDALHALKQSATSQLYGNAVAAKVSALIGLGDLEYARKWLSTQDRSSNLVAGYLIKTMLLAGDGVAAEKELSARILQTKAAGSEPANLFSYEVASILARAISHSFTDVHSFQREVTGKFSELAKQVPDRSGDFYDRCAFMLAVVEAKCWMLRGSLAEALEAVDAARELLVRRREINSSAASMEFLAVSGETQLMRGNPEKAACHFEELSVRFSSAEDSPVYFKRSIWGLIDAYAGNGRFDRLDGLKAALEKRSLRHGDLLSPWCLALSLYADARVGRQVDLDEWGKAIVEAKQAGSLTFNEVLVLGMRRAFTMMNSPDSGPLQQVGVQVLSEFVEKLAAQPDQLSVVDTWRISRMLDRWFAEALTHGLVHRAGAATMIMKILGKAPLFAGKFGTYKRVVEGEAARNREGMELVIEV
jgi:hypothetical protein